MFSKMIFTGGLVLAIAMGCGTSPPQSDHSRMVTDQLGRKVRLPARITKIAALHHFGGKITYALKQDPFLVEKSIYGKEALALAKVDKLFAKLPESIQGHAHNVEGLISRGPQVVFLYASGDQGEIDLYTRAGIPVIGVKGETFEQSYGAVRLMAKVLQCQEKGENYIRACKDLLKMVAQRIHQGRTGKAPVRVLFTGPKSIYSVATGHMLQTEILESAGAVNVAKGVKGFWADVSPEQIAAWDPEVIFMGSTFNTLGKDQILANPHFSTVTAIKTRQIYTFPSNIGWWDYPAPHAVLGVVWSAKTLYPNLFEDVDILALANTFYKNFLGHSFEEMGGKLP
ncbi:MAG: ABC transporter substrate-binding protein [Desulfobacter sp.]|nr:ABC transporter substrate-binding protein [Desulfobacter sp.]